jgi:hypothetical protein
MRPQMDMIQWVVPEKDVVVVIRAK